jgi:TolB-like protein/DNA-binding winged helix-turn-helix (wHTH) protein/Tfp pilus assembly protein PilF
MSKWRLGAGTAQVFHFGDFTLDQSRYRLQRGERILRLERQPMELLFLLVERRGELVTREEAADRLWGTTVFVDIDQSINTAVRKVRMVLRDDPDKPRFIETVVGKGYRFAALVTCNGETLKPMGPDTETNVLPSASVAYTTPTSHADERALSWKTKLPLVALCLLAVVSFGWLLSRRYRPESAARPTIESLAVLPLRNLSGDPAQEYLADGITEELIGRLSRIHDLRVISRTSVMRLKNMQLAIPEISKMVGADALVEGSVIREGNRIRVHAQLIRGATDEHFWAESYDRELGDLFTLESDVAQAIAERVEVTITGAEHQQLTKVSSVSPEVYEFYLKGRFSLSHSKNEGDVDEAIGYFEQASMRDPTFAPNYVGLAIGHALRGSILVGGAPPEDERAKGIRAAQKALQLDPELPEAYVVLADLHQTEWHWSEAEAEYRRALVLNPNDANAHAKFALWLLCQGRADEALKSGRRGRQLDPLAVSGDLLGWVLYIARRYSEAIQELRSASSTNPDNVGVLWRLGFVLIANNQPREAIPVLEKAVRISNRSPGVVGVLAKAYALAGQRRKAVALLEELQRRRQRRYVPAAAFVNAYLGLGDTKEVFVWLDQGFKEKSNLMQWLAVDPMFDSLRSDPRFVDLLHRVGLG